MAESNGGNRLDDHEQRLARLEAARRELEDSFIVMTHLETKAAARIREHAEFIAAHEAAIAKQEAATAKQVERTSVLDERVDKLVLAIGKLISRIPPSGFSQ
jgi:flagellar biosynthesis chaperone FliJ